MSYLVLARKWRPQSFEDLVGQEHVSRTLGNAIASDRVAHAFLFTGVRGVGKTTTARILAKALQCAEGPTATPCQKCAPCHEILDGRDVDVQEIDGASYNGVDEVRKLQESLPYRPSRDRYKIYIVDEVHMLSTAAWNAFLKTLEEPPPHVKFIFATTEVHKVPATILSRCQRFDFKLIGTADIAARLRKVLEAESIAFDDAAVAILAREAAGSMRDAMSLLDQVIAWTGGAAERLTADGVARVLGVAARSVLHRLGAALHAGEPGRCVEIVGQLAEQGYGMPNVAKDFLQHLRDLVVVKVCSEPGPLVGVADEELVDLRELAARADPDDLSRLYLGFSRAFDDIARSGHPRAAFEMALVRLARRPALVPVGELIERLERLERKLAPPGAPGRDGGRGPSGGGGDRAPGVGSAERGGKRGGPTARAESPAAGAAGANRDSRLGERGTGFDARPPSDVDDPPTLESGPLASPSLGHAQGAPRAAWAMASESPTRAGDADGVRPVRRTPGARLEHSDPARAAAGRLRRRDGAPSSAAAGATDDGPVRPARAESPEPTKERAPRDAQRAQAAAASPPKAAVARTGRVSMDDWRRIVERVAAQRPAVASVFEHGAPLEVRSGLLVLGYAPGSFLLERAAEPGAVALLGEVATAHWGEPTTVELDTAGGHEGVVTLAAINAEELKKREAEARRAVAERPLVRAAERVLGAVLKEVRLPDRQS